MTRPISEILNQINHYAELKRKSDKDLFDLQVDISPLLHRQGQLQEHLYSFEQKLENLETELALAITDKAAPSPKADTE
jgi:predicted  nucleic acid-binding Zn-ribbon protein